VNFHAKAVFDSSVVCRAAGLSANRGGAACDDPSAFYAAPRGYAPIPFFFLVQVLCLLDGHYLLIGLVIQYLQVIKHHIKPYCQIIILMIILDFFRVMVQKRKTPNFPPKFSA
jgi:hypothetical protein